MGRITKIIDPKGYVSEIAYNSKGKITSTIDPEGNKINLEEKCIMDMVT